MANLGNTGQRYKLRKFVKVEIQDEKLRVSLECGHSYYVGSPHEWGLHYYQRLIDQGKRTRCLECQKG